MNVLTGAAHRTLRHLLLSSWNNLGRMTRQPNQTTTPYHTTERQPPLLLYSTRWPWPKTYIQEATATITNTLSIVRTTTLLLATALLLLACTGTDPTPTRVRDPMTHQYQQLQTETAQLREETASLRNQLQTRSLEREKDDLAIAPPDDLVPTPIPTPTTVVIPTPSGPGICGRSPAVQQAILNSLRISSCRTVTNDELFRITELTGDLGQLKAGDLSGLVNLKQLTVSGDYTLPAGTFAGAAIQHLTVGEMAIHPNAFDGMINLEQLRFSRTEEIPPLTAPVFATLESLDLDLFDSNDISHAQSPPNPALLASMPGLKYFEVYQATKPDDTALTSSNWQDDQPQFLLPSDLFKNNPNLESVNVRYSHSWNDDLGVRYRLVVPHDIVSHLTNLKAVSIRQELHIADRPEKAPKLELSPESPLGQYLTPPNPLPNDWKDTRQYKDLFLWHEFSDPPLQSISARLPQE